MPDTTLRAAISAVALGLLLAAPAAADQRLARGEGSTSTPTTQAQVPEGVTPGASNVELVSRLQLETPEEHRASDDPLVPGQIADVSHKGDFAYLNSWQSETEGRCERGGVFVVDISDPANPEQVAFIKSPVGTYPGEGSQVIEVDTPSFSGDVLAVNNEYCEDDDATPATLHGGFSLYDVTDPLSPVPLTIGSGDSDPSDAYLAKASPVHDYHSVFMYTVPGKAYLVGVDNYGAYGVPDEGDIDIFDISNPSAPQQVADIDLREAGLGTAYGNGVFHHDLVVKTIGGRQVLLASYWDAGYVKLDVTDPANPTILGDTDFGPDPQFPQFSLAEGNAHQAEFSHDDRFIVAADEDFNPFRGRLNVLAGPGAGGYDASESTDALVKIADMPGERITSKSVTYVGTGCGTQTGSIPAAPADDGDPATQDVAVLERGGDSATDCTFRNKAERAAAAGWDAWVIFNQANRPDGDPLTTNATTVSPIPGVLVTRATALGGIFGGANATPAIGTQGQPLRVNAEFDGWGYMHLYDAATMDEIDTFAASESKNPDLAIGHGDLSVHETANDPVTNLAYVAYYAAGFRVMRFGTDGLEQVGRFVDSRGNNFWGVDVVADRGADCRLVLASDRDFGLYVLRYTGPGAVGTGACNRAPQATGQGGGPQGQGGGQVAGASASAVPNLIPSFFGFGSLKRVTITGPRKTITLTMPGAGKLTASLRARIGRRMVTLASTRATARGKGPVRLQFTLSRSARRRLAGTVRNRPTRRTSGVLRVQFTPTGGIERTRNRAISLGIG